MSIFLFLEFWRNVLSQYVKVFSFLNLIETYLVNNLYYKCI